MASARPLRWVVVHGRSMGPSAAAGEIFWLDKVDVPQRGAMVAWTPPAIAGTTCLKRVIGLPGEQVRCRGGRVWINAALLREPYLVGGWRDGPAQEWRLGADEFLLLGDRRAESLDSRRLGPAARSDLQGVVRRRLWPFRWRLATNRLARAR